VGVRIGGWLENLAQNIQQLLENPGGGTPDDFFLVAIGVSDSIIRQDFLMLGIFFPQSRYRNLEYLVNLMPVYVELIWVGDKSEEWSNNEIGRDTDLVIQLAQNLHTFCCQSDFFSALAEGGIEQASIAFLIDAAGEGNLTFVHSDFIRALDKKEMILSLLKKDWCQNGGLGAGGVGNADSMSLSEKTS